MINELDMILLQTFQRVDEGWNFSLFFEKKKKRVKKTQGFASYSFKINVLSWNAKKTKGISWEGICSLTQ